MREKARNAWENVNSSLWFVPTVLAALALLLASVLVEVDVALLSNAQARGVLPWLFSGTADAARSVLSTIAGSLITVISIAFSLIIIALQQASAQFTPRVLRSFTADRGNQIVLGMYIATFLYALLVLRAVRSASQDLSQVSFVPALSVTVAIVLAIICLGLLIYFIHHTSQSLQVSVILERVRTDLNAQIDARYPDRAPDGIVDQPPLSVLVAALAETGACHRIHSERTGFIRTIDEDAIRAAPLDGVRSLWIQRQVGEFVTTGGILAEYRADTPPHAPPDGQLARCVRDAFIVDDRRSINQDPLFGVRQLVDIALKGLSPGINDPTTADYALYHLGDALGRLADRAIPPVGESAAGGAAHLFFTRPTWDDFVDAAFDQVRRAATGQVQVLQTLLDVLADLAVHVPPGSRGEAIRRQVAEIRRIVARAEWSEADTQSLTVRADVVDDLLPSRVPVP